MLRFLEQIIPYETILVEDHKYRSELFMKNVLEIEKNNRMQFFENMNNKEKELMDVFDKMKDS